MVARPRDPDVERLYLRQPGDWLRLGGDSPRVSDRDGRGGAEELCPSEAAVFDTLFATSQRNDEPKTTPSPFDTQRDGLVIGEGAGTLILEELEHARARGATIYGEIVGFATNCDAAHITQPQRDTMQICMEQSLAMAGLSARDMGYISAHGNRHRSRRYRRKSGHCRHLR